MDETVGIDDDRMAELAARKPFLNFAGRHSAAFLRASGILVPLGAKTTIKRAICAVFKRLLIFPGTLSRKKMYLMRV